MNLGFVLLLSTKKQSHTKIHSKGMRQVNDLKVQ